MVAVGARYLAQLDVTQDYLVREFVDNYEDGAMAREDMVERVYRIADRAGSLERLLGSV